MSNILGDVFPEELYKSQKIRYAGSMDSAKEPDTGARLIFFIIVLITGLGILYFRLFQLTVVQGEKYRKLAQENMLREEGILAPRGIIYDRSGTALVRNIPVFILPDKSLVFDQKAPSEDSKITESVSREYIYSDLFAHVLGYVGEVDSKDLSGKSKSLGDMIGKMGIEEKYDSILSGQNGKMMYEVDALGNRVRVLGKTKPVDGKNIYLTLDLSLQKAAQEALLGKTGAVVAANPETGEIYTLYSSPSFDPNRFIRREGAETYFTDPKKPLFNRAISGLYPPGSTFKIITSMAALEEGVVNSSTKLEDTGVIKVGGSSFSSWNFTSTGKKEGLLDIIGAIKRSNDIFFYKTGELLGIEKLAFWGKMMGVGRETGIDINGEEKGLMPDPAWMKDEKGETWYLGNTYNVSIGQGDILSTPLQVNEWTNMVATLGTVCKPHLYLDQNTKSPFFKNQCKNLEVKKENLQIVREGMMQACQTGGTAYPLFNFKVINDKLKIDGENFLDAPVSTFSAQKAVEIVTACKTGTSEFGDPKGKTHAWFTVFAPAYKPEISVTVLVDEGGEGSSVAAPIAKKILEAYFTK